MVGADYSTELLQHPNICMKKVWSMRYEVSNELFANSKLVFETKIESSDNQNAIAAFKSFLLQFYLFNAAISLISCANSFFSR